MIENKDFWKEVIKKFMKELYPNNGFEVGAIEKRNSKSLLNKQGVR